MFTAIGNPKLSPCLTLMNIRVAVIQRDMAITCGSTKGYGHYHGINVYEKDEVLRKVGTIIT